MKPKSTLTRFDIADAISRSSDLSHKECTRLVENILQVMSDALVETGEVKIASFGSFRVREKSERMGRNPKTMQDIIIAERKSIIFRASGKLKARVAEGKNHKST
jgi:integration host factor subunit alpha